ncbi:hypothetical protein JCM17844_06660 [Iodidimonas gelatinilytica]|uniref:PRC-barrel domain-containing protein n=1 Tax=Iodidimonas gelatinilytica TaxID=1236966 RepID=A0A5A7MQ86_9PROT|nr:PRC-barrel domain-containing protein [Iodidimonas gelatinilytica]GEQ97029.1 hypothetical protein JCM17844_06660 [Iodidimonas gelatinilytica]
MPKFKQITIGALAAAMAFPVATLPAFAGQYDDQTKPAQHIDKAQKHLDQAEDQMDHDATKQMDQAKDKLDREERITARTNIEGKNVLSTDGDTVGSVEELVVSKTDNKLYAVISVGGFLGIGDRDVAVPYEKLSIGSENVTIMSQQAKTDLRNMPEYDEEKFEKYDPKERHMKDAKDTYKKKY